MKSKTLKRDPAPSGNAKEPSAGKLGTFAGVFTPSALTILGIILFLRLGYVVGAAGAAKAFVIIAMANVISVLTSFSLSAVATNLKVKGGGDYYLISRTLGVEFGGAIGFVLFLAQAVSITILLNWLDSENESGIGFREFLFGRQLRTVFRLGCNIAILHADPEKWDRLQSAEAGESRIDIWWTDDATGRLMLLFAYLMTRSDAWETAMLRVLAFRNDASEDDQEAAMREVLTDARIEAGLELVEDRNAAAMVAASRQSALVFLPFRFRGNLIRLPVEGRAENLLEQLPPTAMLLAAEDIDLGAEPEEGAAADLAEAKDLLEEKEKLAEAAERESAKAQKIAEDAEKKLNQALDRPASDQDEDLIATLTSEKDVAVAAVEKSRRRAAKAGAKAADAKKSLEDENKSAGIATDDI